MQILGPEAGQVHAAGQAGHHLATKQLRVNSPGGPSRHQLQQEPTVHPEGQLHPGLY